jgi:hypothetical protein
MKTDYKLMSARLLALFTSFASLTVAPMVHALADLDSGALVLEVTAGVEYDTNIFTNSLEEGDLIGRVKPVLRYIQDSGVIHLEASAGVDMAEFKDFGEQSSQDFITELSLSGFHRDDSPLTFAVVAGWREETWASEEVGTRIESELLRLAGSADFKTSEKLGLRTTVDFSDSEYANAFYPDAEDLEARVDMIHYYSEKLQFAFGYRYRDISYDQNFEDQKTDTLIVGAEGQLSGKLTGFIEVGYIFQDNDYDDTVLYNVGLTWKASEKTNLKLTGGRDNSISLAGENAISTNVTLWLHQNFTDQVSGRAFIGYGEFEREGANSRNDESYRVGTGLTVNLTESNSLDFNISYEDRESDSSFSNYKRFLISAGLNFLY